MKSFQFFREFKVELREDPSSVFATDIVIENTNGPIDYDLSRVYTGKLEGEFVTLMKDFFKSLPSFTWLALIFNEGGS